MEELQAILEAVDASVAAQDFSTMTDEQLAEAVSKISDYGSSLKKSDKPTKQEIEDVITLASALEAVQGEVAKRDEANAELKAQFDAAAAKFGGEPDPDPDPIADPEPTPTIPPVTASRPSAAEVARRRPIAAEPKTDQPKALVAAAGDKEGSFGSAFEDAEALGAVMFQTWNQLRDGGRTVARIPRQNRYELKSDDPVDNFRILSEVARKSQDARNEGLALTAALGCAPSEPVYEFFNQSVRGAGLVDLPSVTARRGSRTYPPAVGFTSIDGQAGIGSLYTGASKSCYTVNCGTLRPTDVIANYVCLSFQNEQGLFYPELVDQYQALAMIAYEHEVNQRLIENMRDHAITNEIHDLDTGGGTVIGLIRAALRVRAWYIERHKMAENAVVDVLMPYWFAAAYAVDIVTRQSTDMATSINLGLARIESELRQGGVNAQFVYDWQVGPAEGFDDFGSMLVYAPGTYVRLDGPTLDLGVVRDSTLNAANDFQVFFEGWTGLAAPGIESVYVQGVETCPLGQTALGSAVTCGAS